MSRQQAIQARVQRAVQGEPQIEKRQVSGIIRRANTLSDKDIEDALYIASKRAQPERDALLILLTCRLGMRIGEAAHLYAEDILDSRGELKDTLWVSGRFAKYGKEREVPLNRPEVVAALKRYLAKYPIKKGPLFFNQYGEPLSAGAGQKQVTDIYQTVGLHGCSSHSGRRTFGTRASRHIAKVDGSLRDVQKLMGHSNLKTTEAYIDYTPRQADIVAMI